MLAKLIKYDLKFIFKTVSVFIILLFIGVILHNLTSYDYTPTFLDASGQVFGGDPDAPVIIQFLHTFFYNAVITFAIALVINSLTRTWQRFRNNFYGDEAYLTHTLPLPRQTLWAAKVCTGVLISIIIIAAIALACILLSLTPTGQGLIGGFGVADGTPTYYCVYTLCIAVQLFFIILCGYTGIIIARRFSSSRPGLRSVLWGLLVYLLSSTILVGLTFIWSHFDADIHTLLFGVHPSIHTDPATNMNIVIKTLFAFSLVYILNSTILYFVDRKLLQRSINLE